jgi:hypothetical protein
MQFQDSSVRVASLAGRGLPSDGRRPERRLTSGMARGRTMLDPSGFRWWRLTDTRCWTRWCKLAGLARGKPGGNSWSSAAACCGVVRVRRFRDDGAVKPRSSRASGPEADVR